jgi:hypothetical protein
MVLLLDSTLLLLQVRRLLRRLFLYCILHQVQLHTWCIQQPNHIIQHVTCAGPYCLSLCVNCWGWFAGCTTIAAAAAVAVAAAAGGGGGGVFCC